MAAACDGGAALPTAEDAAVAASCDDGGAALPTEKDAAASCDDGAADDCAATVEETQADTPHRRRDKRKVETRLGLVESGEAGRLLYDATAAEGDEPLAVGYRRVVYGDAGAYVELEESHLRPGYLDERMELRTRGRYYDLYKAKKTSAGGSTAELYHQTRRVADRPNPPRGRDSKRRDRAEGYADYVVGCYYLSARLVRVEGRCLGRQARPVRRGGKEVGRGEAMLEGAAAEGGWTLRPIEGVIAKWAAAGDSKCGRFRFRRLAPSALADAAGLPLRSCVSVRCWRRGDDRRLCAVTVAPGDDDSAPLSPLLAALPEDVGNSAAALRRASTADVERACAWPRNYDALPLAPQPPADCPVLLDARLLAEGVEAVHIHVPRGMVASAPPAKLLDLAKATVVDLDTLQRTAAA